MQEYRLNMKRDKVGGIFKSNNQENQVSVRANEKGRFPANFIHDGSDDVIELFPYTKSTGGQSSLGAFSNGKIYNSGKVIRTSINPGLGDSGSAARFFYCAKTSKKDREEDLDILSNKQYTFFQTDGGASGKASSLSEERNTSYKNIHPTVKPTALMSYLIKLVTPDGGIVLDPFMGSGSTGKACMKEGFKFIGMEMERNYFDIAYLRTKAKGKYRVKRIKV